MKNLYQGWKKVASKIGDFQLTVIFSLLYFVLLTPIGLIASWMADFLTTRGFPSWRRLPDHASTLDKLNKQ